MVIGNITSYQVIKVIKCFIYVYFILVSVFEWIFFCLRLSKAKPKMEIFFKGFIEKVPLGKGGMREVG